MRLRCRDAASVRSLRGMARRKAQTFWCPRSFWDRNVIQDGVLAEIELDPARHVDVHRLVVGDAGSKRVGKRDAAGADHREQARHAEHGVGAEGQRIHEEIVDAAVDDVDLDRPFGGAHPHIAVAHEQVSALDELDAHLLGEEHVLKISAVVAARREQNDHRVLCP
jgi:hypothetical protein